VADRPTPTLVTVVNAAGPATVKSTAASAIRTRGTANDRAMGPEPVFWFVLFLLNVAARDDVR
jgi:hypothetical protein